jgi:hypothetical protein
MKIARISLLLGILITLIGCSENDYHISSRAHSMGLKQSVRTMKRGQLSFGIEQSGMVVDDIIALKQTYHSWNNPEDDNHYEETLVTAYPGEIQTDKSRIYAEIGLTDQLTVDGGLIFGTVGLTDWASEVEYPVSRMSENDTDERIESSLLGFSAGAKYKVVDKPGALSLSVYSNYERFSLDGEEKISGYNCDSSEIHTGLITGFIPEYSDWFVPSWSVFYQKHWDERNKILGSVAETSEIESFGLEMNVYLRFGVPYILTGVGYQKEIGGGPETEHAYGFFKFGFEMMHNK